MMGWKDVLMAAWAMLNSDAGLVFLLSLCVYVLNKVLAKKPSWQKYVDRYKGTIMSAIKTAEKNIPDDTDNKAMHRLDEALKLVIKTFSEDVKRQPTDKEVAEIKEAIKATHVELESNGAL